MSVNSVNMILFILETFLILAKRGMISGMGWPILAYSTLYDFRV